MIKPSICIIGPGVVGQATGKVFVEKGIRVGFLGRTSGKVDVLKKEGYNAFTKDEIFNGNYDYDVSMLTVPTPTLKGKIDLSILKQASIDLGKRLKYFKKYHLVVVKSTVPPGTTENLVIPIIEKYSGKRIGKDFGACMNPEYLREEKAYDDTLNPWMVLIGEYDEQSGNMLNLLYEGKFNCPIYRCGLKEAEMQKYVHNLFNAVKISFYNEMREIAGQIDVDADKVFKYAAISCEGMWNPKYGIRDMGPFQGSCLPKDTKAFFHWAQARGFDASLLKTAIDVNNKLISKLGLHEFSFESKNIL